MYSDKFNELIQIVKALREKCPWDKEQTNNSIKAATLEEAYEVIDAIDCGDFEELKKELGDLLFHVIFHSVIAEEDNKFNIADVIESIKEKLIRRHPHVFGEVEVENSEDVKKNWEKIKLSEGRSSVLEGIPDNFPSLLKAYRIQEKASKVGFDWNKKEDVWKKVIEEIEEMHQSEKQGNNDELEEEIGDVFFALTNYSRFLGINPENALRRANNKFFDRFRYIESKIGESGRQINDSTLEEMDKYWEESKVLLKRKTGR